MTKPIQLTPEQLELATKLTPLQRRFVLELIKPGMSQRQAYINAGGTSKTPETQDKSASVMVSNGKVKEFHQSLINSIASDVIMTKQEALERLSKTARATIHDICTFKLVEVVTKDKDGNEKIEFDTIWTMKHTDEIDPVIAAAIKSVTFTKMGPKIEMYDANGSIKILSDLQGWNAPKKQEITGKDGQALAIKADVSAPEIASALDGLMQKL
jgi:phage terminase small subunit